jgi:antitoxin component YwqK of YwqJK toxin-antitoxin module
MITKFAFSIILILLATIATSQDIKYFNKEGKVTNAKNASYFETIIKLSDNQIRLVKQKMNKDTISYTTYSSLSPLTRNGITKIFYDSGTIHYFKNYKDNKLEGKTIRFYEDGKIKSIITLAQDSAIIEKSFDKNGNEIKYLFDGIAPKYQNKPIDNFRYYLLYNINYPQVAIDHSISDKCIVEFLIDENGNVKDIDVKTDIIPFKNEIVKAIQKTNGKWTPGERYGECFKSRFTMTINFHTNQ